MTLAQWKSTRRVDHVNLGLIHPRYRAFKGRHTSLRHLKDFDVDVVAYHAATNEADKLSILGRIIQGAKLYLDLPDNSVEQRYIDAVRELYDSASMQYNQICGGDIEQPQRLTDLNTLNIMGTLTPKNISLNFFYLAPVGTSVATRKLANVDLLIDHHVTNANAVYQHASIVFARSHPTVRVATQTANGHSILTPERDTIAPRYHGTYGVQGTNRDYLITYCNERVGAAENSIDVVYLDNYYDMDALGNTIRANHNYGGFTAHRPICTVTLNPPPAGVNYGTTLAHELGHALSGFASHSVDPNNLMAGGAIRTGVNFLSDGQIAWYRNNPNS